MYGVTDRKLNKIRIASFHDKAWFGKQGSTVDHSDKGFIQPPPSQSLKHVIPSQGHIMPPKRQVQK